MAKSRFSATQQSPTVNLFTKETMFDQMLTMVRENSRGGTFWFNANKNQWEVFFSSGGYLVSANDRGIEHLPKLRSIVVKDFASEYSADLSENICMLGFWFDKFTGSWSIDIVTCPFSREIALDIARVFHQKAIWDIVNDCEIRVETGI